MDRYQYFVKRVVMSCENYEQLHTCIQWIDKLEFCPIVMKSIVALIGIKTRSLMKSLNIGEEP